MPESTNYVQKYLDSLEPFEVKAMEIAKTQLDTSFSVEKSIGYLSFVKKCESEKVS